MQLSLALASVLLLGLAGCASDPLVDKGELGGPFHYTAGDASAEVRFVIEEGALLAYPSDAELEDPPLVGFVVTRHVAADGDRGGCSSVEITGCVIYEPDDGPLWYERSYVEVDFSSAIVPDPARLGLPADAEPIPLELDADPWLVAERDDAGELVRFEVPARYRVATGTLDVVHRFER